MTDPTRTATGGPPRLERLKVSNFRALKGVEIQNITPLTVLLGPNGSGKSTIFDVFAFLSECFESGLRGAWDRRGRARELKSRGRTGPVAIEIGYRESPKKTGEKLPTSRLITYRVEVDEDDGQPVVAKEVLRWTRNPGSGQPTHILEYGRGQGYVVSDDAVGDAAGDARNAADRRIEEPLSSPDILAVNALGQLRQHPRVVALRNFITGWRISYLSADDARGQPEAGPQEHLDKTGNNLANVVQYLAERHPQTLEDIFGRLRRRIPQIEQVTADPMPDGRLLLRIKDAPFDEPVMARFASDGTLKMLAYLVMLHDPDPPPFLGVEEPENFLHPRLLHELAEECGQVAETTQIFATTHSPFFLNALRPENVRVLWRDQRGYTQCHALSDDKKVGHLVEAHAMLGDLWMEKYFDVGAPLTGGGAPPRRN